MTSGDQSGADRANHRSDVDQQRLVWAVELAGRFLLGNKPCLPQALAVLWLLRRRGIYANLNIGVKKDDELGILAHAWIEKGGVVIIGGEKSPVTYKRLQTINSQEI